MDVEATLEGLYGSLEIMLEKCLTVMFRNWENAWETFNEGQSVIYETYIWWV